MPLSPARLPDILLVFHFITFYVTVYKIKPGKEYYITYCFKCNFLTFPNLISFIQMRD